MADLLKPSSTFLAARSPIVEKDGTAKYFFIKILQDWDTKLNNGLNQIGQITQPIPATIPVEGRSEGLGITLQYIDSNGVVTADGIDFARDYINKDTDHIRDGSGLPLDGGRAAEIALVGNTPTPEPSKWINGMVAGVFTKSQPAFTDVSGQAAPTQVPDLSSLNGQITTAQLPAGLFSGTVTLAKLTTLGSNGSMTIVNGSVSAYTPPT